MTKSYKILCIDDDPAVLAVLEWLEGNSRTTWIPIFMLTSRLKMTDVEKALSRGAAGYFTKPLKFSEISTRLERLAKAA